MGSDFFLFLSSYDGRQESLTFRSVAILAVASNFLPAEIFSFRACPKADCSIAASPKDDIWGQVPVDLKLVLLQ